MAISLEVIIHYQPDCTVVPAIKTVAGSWWGVNLINFLSFHLRHCTPPLSAGNMASIDLRTWDRAPQASTLRTEASGLQPVDPSLL